MPFRNDVAGGQGALILPSLHSPDYVPGVSGWTINKDGTAEFADIALRGRLALALLSSAANHTSDVYWEDGLTTPGRLVEVGQSNGAQVSKTLVLGGGSIDNIAGITGGRDASIILDSYTPNDVANPQTGTLRLFGYSDTQVDCKQVDGIVGIGDVGVAGAKTVLIGRQGIAVVGSQGAVNIGGDVHVGGVTGGGSGVSIYSTQTGVNGPKGKYYFEQFAIGAVPVPTGAATLTPLATVGNPLTVTKSRSDYDTVTPMALTTAIWTCPETGPYTIAMQAQYAGGVAGTRVALYALRNANGAGDPDLVMDVMDGSGRGRISASTSMEYTAGDTLKFEALQVTGAAQTIHPGPGSYISISRAL